MICVGIFLNRVIHAWNSLPNKVDMSDSLDMFEHRLYKFCIRQEIKFNWKANIAGTGGRSTTSSY
jgi:hypothetical protein